MTIVLSEHAISAPAAPRRALYAPWIDFLLLGGASFFVLPVCAALAPNHSAELIFAGFLLSFVINFPHFAHSYQIFYRDFANKLRGRGYARHLGWRYAVAGVAAPLLLAAGLYACYAARDRQALAWSISAMTFFVGWHYVKQGYGMLIVDSVFNRSFFSDREKRLFLVNAYACWIFFYLLFQHLGKQREMFGLSYLFLPAPQWLVYLAGAVCLAASLSAIAAAISARSRNADKPTPFNGYVAYVMSCYVWLGIAANPTALVLVPALHSLQYLAVVWRFESNRQRAAIAAEKAQRPARTLWVRFATFIGIGMALGGLSLAAVPMMLDNTNIYDASIYGANLFLILFSVFINIHHYFLDNVMWRKDNPDVGTHLFGAR